MKFTIFLCLIVSRVWTLSSQTFENTSKRAEIEKYTGPIIDMHLHANRDGYPLFGLTHPPTLRGQTFEGVSSAAEQKEQVLKKMKEHNIVLAVVTHGELWKEDAPDNILIAASNEPVEALRKRFENGKLQALAEMAPFYGGVRADDPSQQDYFELAEGLGIPVGFHVFPGGPNYGFHLMPQMLGGMRAYNANPMQLEEVLVKFPDLKLYIMHGGWPYVDDVKALMYAHPNLYVDVAVVNWILPKEEFYHYIQTLIRAGFGDRILYGTDQMAWPQTMDIGVDTLNSADFLTWEQKEDIFYDNAARFLGLSPEEIAVHKNQGK